jgi:hypothetical protein
MTKLLRSKIAFIFLILFSITAQSQYYNLSPVAKISILTCGSGNELYSIYGHTAMRIEDSKNNLDIVINYGNFDFRTTNFYAKFVKGDLKYFAGACTYNDFMAEYIETNRDVFEQNLLISQTQKQKLFDELNASLYSDERFYTYKFIDKNCTTMVLNKINGIFGKTIVTKQSNTNVSYRSVLYSYLDNHFFENLGINIIFGAKTDAPATKLFLPKELMDNLKLTKFNNKPIVANAVVLNKSKVEEKATSWWNNFYFFTSFFILILVLNQKIINLFYLSVLGLMGIFFSLVGFYSLHHEVCQNYNVLIFNPSLLLLIYFYIQKNNKWIVNFAYLNLVSIAVYIVVIMLKVDFVMMLPVIITSLVIITKMRLKSRKS